MFPLPKFNLKRDVPVLCLVLIGFQQLGSAGYIQGKAHFAQYLIASAWERTLDTGGVAHKPWPWADTWPVARMEVPQQSVDLYVLAGATGNALAFGPGYELASAALGDAGLSMIGGHRDTHFGFLKDMKSNSLFSLQLPSGERIRYRVAQVKIINVKHDPLPNYEKGTGELQLVTCYPFDDLLPGGPLRYVVIARRDSIAQPTGREVAQL